MFPGARNPTCLPLLVFKCGEHYVFPRKRISLPWNSSRDDYNFIVCISHDVTDRLIRQLVVNHNRLLLKRKIMLDLVEYSPGAASPNAPSQNHPGI